MAFVNNGINFFDNWLKLIRKLVTIVLIIVTNRLIARQTQVSPELCLKGEEIFPSLFEIPQITGRTSGESKHQRQEFPIMTPTWEGGGG